ncbi:hypothetical protein PIB30_111890, partial [Stylosanthes scabra]|nr:hypothetical protein [Stylosanthes scabra]
MNFRPYRHEPSHRRPTSGDPESPPPIRIPDPFDVPPPTPSPSPELPAFPTKTS